MLQFARQDQVLADINKWENILLNIQAVLDDAEEKQPTSRMVKMCLDDLGDLAYKWYNWFLVTCFKNIFYSTFRNLMLVLVHRDKRYHPSIKNIQVLKFIHFPDV